MNKYQGFKEVSQEISNGTVEVRFGLEIVTHNGQYMFMPINIHYFDANDEFLLSSKTHDEQRQLLRETNEAVDEYVAQFDNELLVSLANFNYLEALQLRNVKERAGY